MSTNLVNVGFGNLIAPNRVLGMVGSQSKPVKDLVEEARDKGLLITLTQGRGSKTAIFIDTGHIALSALEPEAIAGRIN